MDRTQRSFLESLLESATPSGFEFPGQQRWIEYVEPFADEVTVDDYGNAIAVSHGESPSVLLSGHGDEIGFMVRDIADDGSLQLTAIGGSDRSVARGQHVEVHTSDGPIPGVIGQIAIHLRDRDEDQLADIEELAVDIGATDREEAEALVDRGDPITFAQRIRELRNGRLVARGLDNRIGIWAAAEGFRRAVEQGSESTIYAVSTIQEEIGKGGASMVGYDLAPDVAIAIDVTHATDAPGTDRDKQTGVTLGDGPVISRGSSNHPHLVEAFRNVANDEGLGVQLEATGSRTRTDADAFFVARGAIPSLNLGVPNRYMHTPVELLELTDLDHTADLLAAFARAAPEYEIGLGR